MSKAARTSAEPFDRSIVEGPIPSVVWKIAWPTMLQNILGGLQGIVDHAMVGHFVGFADDEPPDLVFFRQGRGFLCGLASPVHPP